MISKISTKDMTREEWLAERRKSLGGSDIGAILSLNDYQTPYHVWADKTGLLQDEPDNEAMRQGRDLEFYVAERFSELSGLRVRRHNYIVRNTKFPCLHANVDRLVVGDLNAGLECKTASALSESRYAGGNFPPSYYAQCVTYLAVTEMSRWYLCVVILAEDVKCYQMTRIPNDTVPKWCESSVYVSDEEINALCDAANDFWHTYVETGNPPPLMPSDVSYVYITSLPYEVDLAPFDRELERYDVIKRDIKKLEDEAGEIKLRIMEYMQEAERGTSDEYNAFYKTQTRENFDRKAFEKDNPSIDTKPYIKITKSRPFTVKKIEKKEEI